MLEDLGILYPEPLNPLRILIGPSKGTLQTYRNQIRIEPTGGLHELLEKSLKGTLKPERNPKTLNPKPLKEP